MKIKNKIRKIINTLVVGLIAFQTKSNARFAVEPAYGIRQPEPEPVQKMLINNVGDFFRIFLIPIIILTIGIIIYLIKGKKDILDKIITIIIVCIILLIIVLLFFIVWFLVSQS